MINLDETGSEEVSTEQVEVFSLNGTTYSTQAQRNAAFGLRYLSVVREQGEDAAIDWLLRESLGQDGYDALVGFEDLEDAQLMTVFQVCLDIALGAMEGPKGD